MTTKQIAFLIGTGCVLALAGCDHQDIEPAENSDQLRKRELPAEVSVRERVSAEERAEQGVAPSKPEDPSLVAQAANRADTTDTNAVVPDNPTPRRAKAQLDTIGDAKLDAKAVFEEREDGVAVLINVADAKPGTRSVRIYDRESCDDIEEKGLGKPLEAAVKHGNLGSVTIGESGSGTLESKAPSSNLKADDRGSLLGKTIVVQEKSNASSPKAAGDAIACGVIRMDEGLADKAGRMTQPAR